MKKPDIPQNEALRLEALKSYGVLDTLPEQQLEDITLLASQICGTPIALITLVDEHRQWFKSARGITATETPREIAFCGHAINESEVFVVEDAHIDERFHDNPLVTGDLKVRFYAGAQLQTSDGFNIGTLCVVDNKAKKLSLEQINALQALSRQVITNFERKKLAEDLKKQSNFLASVLDVLPFRITYLDRNWKYRYVNPASASWIGRPVSEIIGKTPHDFYNAGIMDAVTSYVNRGFAGEHQVFHSHLSYPERGPNYTRDLYTHCIPDKAEDGSVVGVFLIVEDLTDQIETQRQLHSKEVELQRIFDEIPALISHWDKDLRILQVNRAYAKARGRTPESMRKSTPEEISDADELAARRPHFSAALLGNRQNFETTKRLPDGSIMHSLVSYIPEVENNAVVGLLTIETDISEIKSLENERRFLESRIIASSKMAELGEMAGGVAHEINNPLAIIKGKADQLINRLDSGSLDLEKFRVDLTKIETTVDRIAKIVKGLRSFSRTGDNDPMTYTSISDIIDETLDLCRQRFKNGGIELRYNLKSEVRLECRPVQVSQVLMNLLSNGYDAVEKSEMKWVSIEIFANEQTLSVHVSDSGRGIPAALVEKIMSPFFTTKEIGKGTGLGLSIAKGIAEGHKGSLKLDSNSPNTCFVLELPLRQSAQGVRRAS